MNAKKMFLFLLLATFKIITKDLKFDNILLIINYNHPHYESIPLLKEIYSPVFPNIIFYGPQVEDGVIYIPHHQGFLSYTCISDAMKKHPDFDGYLFLMDDCILSTWLLHNIDTSKIWFAAIPFQQSSKGNPIKLTKGLQATQWLWWHSNWGYKTLINIFEELPDYAIKTLEKNWGQQTVVAAFSDVAYIPTTYKEQFIELSAIFNKKNVFLEIALPTILSCLNSTHDWVWLPAIGTDRNNPTKDFFNSYYFFHHPIKLSHKENHNFIKNLFIKNKELFPCS